MYFLPNQSRSITIFGYFRDLPIFFLRTYWSSQQISRNLGGGRVCSPSDWQTGTALLRPLPLADIILRSPLGRYESLSHKHSLMRADMYHFVLRYL